MKIATILFILICSFVSIAQTPVNTKFDIVDFSKKFETAKWLVTYDLVAWKTSDEVMKQDKAELAKLGREWFCFQDKKNIWNAVYGKIENGRFNLVFHFTLDSDQKVSRSTEKIDAEFLNLHAKALVTANEKVLETLGDKDAPIFNQYIKQNADKTFTVWLLPAFQTNGVAVYGGEAIYTIDKSAEIVIKDESYFQENFRGF